MTQSRLYYEAHVNFEHINDKKREEVRLLCSQLPSWRLATFEMHKKRQPTGFCTGRSDDLDAMKCEVAMMTKWLEQAGIPVLRWKIEDTLFDSNQGDTIEGMLVA